MTIYIALLRGINVGGNKKMKMADLKSALEQLGLGRVQTYILSGNVTFESDETAEALRPRIEQAIVEKFGFTSNVILRTAHDWERIVAGCPFETADLPEGHSVQLTLLAEPASEKMLTILEKHQTATDEYFVNGQEIYFLFRVRMLDSKLGESLQKLGSGTTTRNWNTVMKLASMIEAYG